VSGPYDRKRNTKKKESGLRIFEVFQFVSDFVETRKELAAYEGGVLCLRAERNSQHEDLISGYGRNTADGTRGRTSGVKPGPFTLLAVDFQPQGWAPSLKNGPNLFQGVNVSNDPPVIHVPLVVNRMKSLYLAHDRGDPETEVQGTEGISLLNAARREHGSGMIVQKNWGIAIAPVRPGGEGGQHLAGGTHEGPSVDRVEGVRKVYLQKGHLTACMLLQDISERVSDYLNSPRTTYSVVFPFEQLGDLVFSR
jgi:hypothetical protein